MKRIFSFLLVLTIAFIPLWVTPTAQAAGKKLIAITYDDGPGPYTGQLLDGLKARDVKATFFMLGSNAARYSSYVERAYREGHQLANHSYDHPQLTTLSESGIRSQIQRTNTLLDKACGKGTSYMVRAPYGSVNSAVFRNAGGPLVLWSVDPLDWKYRNAETVKNNILRQSHDGAIILVHDIHATTIPGSLAAIDILKSRGYEFVTVQELFRRRGITPQKGVQYSRCAPNGKDLGPVAPPKVSTQPQGDKLLVTLTAQPGASIYYTTGGGELNQESTRYTGPFLVSVPCTLRAAAAFYMNGSRSDIVEERFAMPVASPPEIQVVNGELVLSSSTPEANLYYSFQNENPLLYQGPVPLEPGTEITAYTQREGWMNSIKVQASYSPLGNLFRDVFPQAWYYSAIDRAAAEGWMGGTGGGSFQPNAPLKRGQLVTLLLRCAKESVDPDTLASMPFADVEENQYYAEAVAWAYEKGMVRGTGENLFRPEGNVSRQEMSQVVFGYLNSLGLAPENCTGAAQKYEDPEQIASWALEAVEAMTAIELLGGDGDMFRPTQACTRAQAAAVLGRMEDYIQRQSNSVETEISHSPEI